MKKVTNNWKNKDKVRKQFEKYNDKSDNTEFSQVILYFLSKHL